jgi:hypothetical protein
MANSYTVDTTDPRLLNINVQRDTEQDNSDALYDEQIGGVDDFVTKQTNALDDYEKEQIKNQNAQTEFAIDKIEQNRENAHKDYIKEQSGAYVDWQKQSSQHGANAEAMAARGMGATGYSESSQVSMYNTYQNRVATARESFIRADTEFKNDITAARLANSSALAQIAFETLQKKLEVSLAGFQYKNTLIQQKAQARREISQDYWSRYNAMYGNIHNENVLKENARQYNESLAETKRHNEVVEGNAAAQLQLDRDKFDYQKEQDKQAKLSALKGSGSGSGGGGGGSAGGKIYKAPKKLNSKIGSKSAAKDIKSKKPTVDQKSVLNLGYGPISASKLNNLVSSGKVKEYEKNGKLKYKKVFSYK